MSDKGDFAQIGLTVVGAAIGFVVSGGNPYGAFVGAQIGYTAGGFFNPTDLGKHTGPRLEDTRVQTSTYGKDIPIVFGKVQVAGNIIWATDIIEDEVDEELGTGKKGKGGGKKTTGTSELFRYYANFAVMFCEGRVGAITRMWADDEIIMDRTGSGPVKNGNINFRIYTGTDNQSADPLIVSYEGAEHTPAYRHRCYVVFERMPIDRYGRRIPVIRAEIVSSPSNIYPGEQITTTAWNLFVGYYPYVDPLRYQIVTGGGGTAIKKIDGITKTVVASANVTQIPGVGSTFNSVVDVFGNVYVQDLNVSTVQDIYRLSPDLSYALKYNAATDTYSPNRIESLGGARPPWNQNLRYFAGNFFSYLTGTDEEDFYLYDINPYTATGAANPTDMTYIAHWDSSVDGFPDAQDGIVFPDGRIFVLCSDDAFGQFGSPGGTYIAELSYTGLSSVLTNNIVVVSTIDLTAYVSGGAMLAYYLPENAFIVAGGNDGKVVKLDRDTGLVTQGSTTSQNMIFAHGTWNQVGTADNGFWYVGTGDNLYHYSFRAMSHDETIATSNFAIGSNDFVNSYNQIYDPLNDAVWFIDRSNYLKVAYLHRVNGIGTTLRTVVSTIQARVDYLPADYDMSLLTDHSVRGYVIGRQMPARSALEPLAKIYQFGSVESDGKIKWISLGTSTIAATITESDIAAHEYGQDEPPLYSQTRIQDSELALQLSFNFMQTQSYEQGTQTAQRDNSACASDNLETFDAAIVLQNDEARQFTEKMLWRQWQNRTSFAFSTNWNFLKLDPLDVINLAVSTAEGTVTHQVRLTEQQIGQNGVINFKGVSEDASTYAIPSTLVGGTASAAVASAVIATSGPSELFVIDSPPLENNDNTPGYYVAVTPLLASTSWSGAMVFTSQDLATWEPLMATADPATAGTANTALASTVQWGSWREGESIEVTIRRGSLSSKTELEVLNGANLALVGNEIIQFQYASAISTYQYKISRLLRGRKGTDPFIGGHQAGERFVMLNSAAIKKINDYTTTTKFLTAQSLNWFLPGAPFPFTNAQKRVTPFTVGDIRVGRPVGSYDAHITWQRRTRIGGEWNNNVGTVPLVDDDDYEIEVFQSAGSSTIVRTIAVSAQTSTVYTSAMQVTDFGTPQELITFRVFQMNDTVGRGFPSRRKTL